MGGDERQGKKRGGKEEGEVGREAGIRVERGERGGAGSAKWCEWKEWSVSWG